MIHFFNQVLRVVLFSVLVTGSVATFAADGTFEIETKVPATLSGKLSYASMKFWVEVSGKDAVELWFNDEDYTALMELVGTQVAFDGSMVTYTNGSVYFQPKLANASAGFTVRKNDELNFDVVDEVAKDHPLRFVSAEKAIHLDHDKTNIKERFKQLSPDTEVKFL